MAHRVETMLYFPLTALNCLFGAHFQFKELTTEVGGAVSCLCLWASHCQQARQNTHCSLVKGFRDKGFLSSLSPQGVLFEIIYIVVTVQCSVRKNTAPVQMPVWSAVSVHIKITHLYWVTSLEGSPLCSHWCHESNGGMWMESKCHPVWVLNKECSLSAV